LRKSDWFAEKIQEHEKSFLQIEWVKTVHQGGGPNLEQRTHLIKELATDGLAPWRAARALSAALKHALMDSAEILWPFVDRIDYEYSISKTSTPLEKPGMQKFMTRILTTCTDQERTAIAVRLIEKAAFQGNHLNFAQQTFFILDENQRRQAALRFANLNVISQAGRREDHAFLNWLIGEIGADPLEDIMRALRNDDFKMADLIACQATTGEKLAYYLDQAQILHGQDVDMPLTQARSLALNRENQAASLDEGLPRAKGRHRP
jgi:hypothetical protein